MRLDGRTLVLSERNLLALLTKLHTPGSACEIEGPDGCWMSVRAEPDLKHYAGRPFPPGPMHPVTARIMAAVREATKGETICQGSHRLTTVHDEGKATTYIDGQGET